MSVAAAAASVPVRPAATVMILDDRPDLHVLLLRRREGSAFVGGMDVFPGGGVDPHDAAPDVEAICDGLGDAEASERLGLANGGLAYWVAAARETFEEAGVLFARGVDSGAAFDPDDADLAERLATARPAIDAGELRLDALARDAGLRLALGALHYAARWITPPGPPRRYDTRFFVTALPAGQIPVADRREAVHAAWVRPADALADFEARRRVMLPPTVGMLRILASFSSSAEVIEAAARSAAGADHRVRLASEGAGAWRVLLPGEELRDAPRAVAIIESEAWVRLCPRAQEG